MDSEIQLISDGDGLAVIGDAAAVERFLVSEGLPSKELELPRLGAVLGTGGAAAQAGSEIAANSGRWVKLTKESAEAMSKYPLMKGSRDGVSRAVLTDKGKTKGFLEVMRTPGSMAANPALLAGVGGLMAQLAMQQAMDEITDYLATIDAKLDDVLRAQKDAVLADMIGVDLVIEEALTIRSHVGGVSEVTWSKVQGTSMTIARTQAYALRQIKGLTEKLERTTKVGDLADASKDARVTIEEWLAVLARCFQLQEAMAVLELDRVLGAAPDELDRHRVALKAARQKRLDTMSGSLEQLMNRLDVAAGTANAKVLSHPRTSPVVLQSREYVGTAVTEFEARLGIESSREGVEARRWSRAAGDVRDKVLETGADGVDASKRFGSATFRGAKSVTNRVSTGIADRVPRRRNTDGDEVDEG